MSLSYLRLGGSSTRPSAARVAADPDFGAFDSDDDDDGHHQFGATPLQQQHNQHQRVRSQSRSPSPARRDNYAITLGDDLQDPLTTAPASTPNQPPSTPSTRIPGAYDFEPQGHEGGHPVVGQQRSAVHSNDEDGDGLGTFGLGGRGSAVGAPSTASYRRPMSLRERLLPAALYARLVPSSQQQQQQHDELSSGLLFSHDGQDSSAEDSDRESSYPPRGTPSHVPLPARPPQFAAPPSQHGGGGRVFGGGQGNDGVFANLSAKPDGANGGDYVGGDEGGNKDEVLPAYEVAAMDTTPPYWETTVVTPGGALGPDDICVDGLPVGNIYGFMWSCIVSMSFQFVGFLLTYLLHSSHSTKNGSRAGLGVTLIQLGFYLKQRADHPELDFPGDVTGLDGTTGPNSASNAAADAAFNDPNNWSWWGGVTPPLDDPSSSLANAASSTLSALGSLPTQLHGALSGVLDASDPDVQEAMRNGSMPSLTGQVSQEEMMRMSAAANEWMAFMMVTVGSFLVIGAVLSYWRAVRWARAVRAGNGPGNDSESMLRSFLAH